MYETEAGYVYSVEQPDAKTIHYEVFRKKVVPICLDFVAKIYSDTDFKEVYPKSKYFGLSARCVNSIEKAESILESFGVESEITIQ